jgi:hypothetical protein
MSAAYFTGSGYKFWPKDYHEQYFLQTNAGIVYETRPSTSLPFNYSLISAYREFQLGICHTSVEHKLGSITSIRPTTLVPEVEWLWR